MRRAGQDLREARRYARNIIAFYLDAPEGTQRAGAVWYRLEHERMLALAGKWGRSVEQVAGAAAAISPGMRWEWIPACLAALRQNPDARVPTYSREFARRAVACLRPGADPWAIISGPKVTAFARLLSGDFANGHVVVDGHAWNVCRQEKHSIRPAPPAARVNDRRYRIAAEAYRLAAKEFGLYPHQVQATTWVHWRDAWGVSPAIPERIPGEEKESSK